MRIALAHNYYQQPGGEDQVFAAEAALLEKQGHLVYPYVVHNDEVARYSKATLAKVTVWNEPGYRQLRKFLKTKGPDVFHLHNTFPLISPSAYYAAKAEGIPVVQTLHNYRLLCPNALFYRDERVCEDCLGKAVAWPGVLHSCYRESRAATSVVAAMLAFHQARGTYTKVVDLYIALSEFAKQKFVEGGLPSDKIIVKPNFSQWRSRQRRRSRRLRLVCGTSREKKRASRRLLSAWQTLGTTYTAQKSSVTAPWPRKSVRAAQLNPGIEWLKYQPRGKVLALMQEASFLILPSVVYENFPMTLVEAFAVGLPVIASKIGSLASLVSHGRYRSSVSTRRS